MPFLKLGPNKYRSPTGKIFSATEVRDYYAKGGEFPGVKAGVDIPAEHVAQRAAPHLKPKLSLRKRLL